MQPTVATAVTAARAAIERALGDVVLRLGATIAARVVEAPPDGGRGLLAFAGALVRARLPAGLEPGQRLALAVAGLDGDRIVLRVRHEHADPAAPRAELAAALVRSGDGELLRAGLALAEGPLLPLRGAGLAEVEVDPDGGGGTGEPGVSEAGFVLHSHRLGPIEVRLRLDGAGVRARVVVEPGAAQEAASADAKALDAALARATGKPAVVDVAARADGERPQLPPGAPSSVDAYA